MKREQGTRKRQTIDLTRLFMDVQSRMRASLEVSKRATTHPGSKGEAFEREWRRLLRTYLPRRYRVAKGFVVDHQGGVSDEIDIIVFDRHFSPYVLDHEGIRFVPAESVYAVMEVKPRLDASTVSYAGRKAASVRRLVRTSAQIPHAGGVYDPKEAHGIPAGLLAATSPYGKRFPRNLSNLATALNEGRRIQFGCILDEGAFALSYDSRGRPLVEYSPKDRALIIFFLQLTARLQALGSAPAIDFDAYLGAVLRGRPPAER